MKTIGIFLAGQQGDILEASCVLKYRQELWGDCKIVWYLEDRNRDLLKYQDIELREFPRGFGYQEMCEEENKKNEGTDKPLWENWQPLVDWDNRMNIALKHEFTSLEDIDIGYFPAPHQMSAEKRHGIEYPNISKKVFGVSNDWQWHPVLKFSEQEKFIAGHFMSNIGASKIVAIETFAGSAQSKITDAQIKETIKICKQVLGECKFIFVSHKYLNGEEKFHEDFINNNDIYFADGFTVRQCALIVGQADLLISVSSGITVASSCWENKDKPFKILQFCGSKICSTSGLSEGRRFELVTHDDRPLEISQNEYYQKLKQILNEIK